MHTPPIPRAIIFGIDGVLARRADSPALERWERRLGLARGNLTHDILDSPASLRAQVGLVMDADVWLELACLFRLHADEVRALASDFRSSIRVDPELVALLKTLRPGMCTGLIGNAWPGARAVYSETCGLGDVVDALVLSAEEGFVMPDTRIYEVAAARLGVSPAEALFVAAREEHVACARDAGLRALRFVGREQLVADLTACRADPSDPPPRPSSRPRSAPPARPSRGLARAPCAARGTDGSSA